MKFLRLQIANWISGGEITRYHELMADILLTRTHYRLRHKNHAALREVGQRHAERVEAHV